MLGQDLNIESSPSFLFFHGEEGNPGARAMERSGNRVDLKVP